MIIIKMAETNISTFRRKVDITAIITHFSVDSLRAKNPVFYSFCQAFNLTTSPKQGALPLTYCSNNEHFVA